MRRRHHYGDEQTMESRRKAGGRGVLADERGISLIEVIVAAVVVGIGAVGVALMFSAGQAYIQAEGDNRVALFLAQQKLEQFGSVGFAAHNVVPISGTDTLDFTPNADQRYTRSWSIVCVDRDNYTSTVDCTTAGAAKLMSVTVQPSPADPKATPVTLSRVLANR
jgi:Tfp pilus assembly protein PilV